MGTTAKHSSFPELVDCLDCLKPERSYQQYQSLRATQVDVLVKSLKAKRAGSDSILGTQSEEVSEETGGAQIHLECIATSAPYVFLSNGTTVLAFQRRKTRCNTLNKLIKSRHGNHLYPEPPFSFGVRSYPR
jgi:hypothetical protein